MELSTRLGIGMGIILGSIIIIAMSDYNLIFIEHGKISLISKILIMVSMGYISWLVLNIHGTPRYGV